MPLRKRKGTAQNDGPSAKKKKKTSKETSRATPEQSVEKATFTHLETPKPKGAIAAPHCSAALQMASKTYDLRSSSKPSPSLPQSTVSSKSKSYSHHSVPSCSLTQNDAIWRQPIFVCDWEETDLCYTLKNLINNDSSDPDSTTLCKWVISNLTGVAISLDNLQDDTKYKNKKGEYSEGVPYYLLDHDEFHPMSRILAPLISSTVAFPDVGIVYNHTIVLRIEIQSSPMRNTVAKLAANLIDDCRYLRHYDRSINKVVGFAFCNSRDNGYVCEVTIEWKNLAFCVSASAMECKKDIILLHMKNALNCHVDYGDRITSIMHNNTTLHRYFIPYSNDDLNLLSSLVSQSCKSQVAVQQVESYFSLVFTDNSKYYYKYCPVISQREHLLYLLHRESRSELLVFPCHVLRLTLRKELRLFVFPKQQYRLSDLTIDQQRSCLFDIANGIKKALEELHNSFKLAHLDVRLDNVCYNDNKVTLIDFDRALSIGETNVGEYGQSFMYTNTMTGENASVSLLDWKQLGLLIFSIMKGKRQTELVARDLESEDKTLVGSLVHRYKWDDILANELPNEQTIKECFDSMTPE